MSRWGYAGNLAKSWAKKNSEALWMAGAGATLGAIGGANSGAQIGMAGQFIGNRFRSHKGVEKRSLWGGAARGALKGAMIGAGVGGLGALGISRLTR